MMDDDLEIYKQQFDSKLDGIKFLQTYYDPEHSPTFEINTWHMRSMVDILQNNKIKGNNILEIGCGPLIMNSLLVSPHFQQLFPGDYNTNIRKPLEGWFSNQEIEFDFSYMIDYISKLHNMDANILSKLTKERFKKTVDVDIHSNNVLSKDQAIESLDAIITKFCIDSCSPTIQSYMKAVRNVGQLLNRDGIFLQMGFFEHNAEKVQKGFWELEDKRFIDLRLTKEEIYKSLEDANLQLIDWKEKKIDCHAEDDFQNTSIYSLYARKM